MPALRRYIGCFLTGLAIFLSCWFTPWILRGQPKEAVPGELLRQQWMMADSQLLYVQIKEGMNNSRKDQDSAIRVIKRRVEESARRGYYDATFQGCFFLGVLYIYRGEYDIAYAWLWRALSYSDKSSNAMVSVFRTLNNIGNIFQYRGDYREATRCYFKAISLGEKELRTNVGVANPLIRIYTSTATALMQLKEHARALYYLDKAETLADRVLSDRNRPAVYVNKAIVYARMGDLRKSQYYTRKALAFAEQFGVEEVRFLALQNQGEISFAGKRFREAIVYLDSALQLEGNINLYYRAGALSLLGSCYLALNEYTQAERYLTQAYEKARSSRLPDHMLDIHRQLASLYNRKGDYLRAYEHSHAAYMLNDSLLNKDKMEAVNLLEIKYRAAENQKQIAQNQLLINLQERRLGQKNMWIAITISGIAALGAVLLGFFRSYRHRQRLHAEQIRSMKQEQEIELLQAMMQGEEKERIRFAHELHDGISSQLSAMKLYLDAVRIHNSGSPVGSELDRMMEMLAETSGDVRKTAHNLMPDGLIRQGLGEATRTYCEQVGKGNLQIEVQTYGDLNHIEGGMALSAYRSIQELVHNIVKHAQATQAIVLLNNCGDLLRITIEDNGIGMEQQTDEPRGIGLKSLQRRLRLMGGRVFIESAHGKGTTVHIEWPHIAGKKYVAADYTS